MHTAGTAAYDGFYYQFSWSMNVREYGKMPRNINQSPTDRFKPEDIWFTITCDEEKQQLILNKHMCCEGSFHIYIYL